ncbi:MAG: hypothetical protein IKK60_05245 [Clostridia bacterium]|nr:hypothetical protein [Clostridia bacterium]
MKKALALILSMLVIFSMFGMVAAAEGEETELVSVTFMVDGEVYYYIECLPGANIVERLQQGDNKLETPEKDLGDGYVYTFKHWENAANGDIRFTGNIPPVNEDTVYNAVFNVEEKVDTQSFWAFVTTIFERINMIFEYFAKVFEGVFDF